MSKLVFECQNCGHCCENAQDEDGENLFGMIILPNELPLFPPELIKPFHGVGIKGRSRIRPQKITAYQLDSTSCPHLVHLPTGKARCRIYGRHPVSCRKFPLETMIGRLRIYSSRCPFIDKNWDRESEVIFADDCYKSEKIMIGHILEDQIDLIFDLRTKKWKPIKDLGWENDVVLQGSNVLPTLRKLCDG